MTHINAPVSGLRCPENSFWRAVHTSGLEAAGEEGQRKEVSALWGLTGRNGEKTDGNDS